MGNCLESQVEKHEARAFKLAPIKLQDTCEAKIEISTQESQQEDADLDQVRLELPFLQRRQSSPAKLRGEMSSKKRSDQSISMADLVSYMMNKDKRTKDLDRGFRSKLHLDSQIKVGLHQDSISGDRDKVCFTSAEYDLVEVFQNIDRDRDRKIIIFDMVR